MTDIIVIAVVVVCAFAASVIVPTAIHGLGKKPTVPEEKKITDGTRLSRDDIQKKLIKLSKSLKPLVLAPGAMCYEVAAVPERAEYVCPKDGTKTLFTNRMRSYIVWELPYLRESVAKLKDFGIEAVLDESEFCKKCTPKQPEDPQVTLIIVYPDGKVHSTRGVHGVDIKLIQEFLNGSKKHTMSNGEEEPLKKHIPRLEQLLGVKVK